MVLFVDLVIQVRVAVFRDEFLTIVKVMPILLHPLQKFFLLLSPEVALVLLLRATKALSLGELGLEQTFLHLGRWIRLNILSPKIVQHLTWDFLKCLLGEHHWVVGKLAEGYKLDDIGSHLLLVEL